MTTEKYVRIIVVGAGPSGLLLGYRLQRSFHGISLTIYEKNPDVAGTWYENHYPGCASDLPSLNYTYTFESRYEWSTAYACASEIKEYFVNFYQKYQLDKYVQLNHKVLAARWDDQQGWWTVEVEDTQSKTKLEQMCDIFINAAGYFNSPMIPKVLDTDKYEGILVHSAKWLDEIVLVGKRVALIGNG